MNGKLVRSATRQLHAISKETIKASPSWLSSSLDHFTRRPLVEQVCPHTIPSSPSNNSANAMPKIELEPKNSITRKLVFHKSKITQLKAMAVLGGVNNPTPVQVMSSLLLKCTIAAATKDSTSCNSSGLFQCVDTRPKFSPPSRKTCASNLRIISEQIKKRNVESKRNLEMLGSSDAANTNMFVFLETGDSFEALVNLEGECMAKFENDKQLLRFASLH